MAPQSSGPAKKSLHLRYGIAHLRKREYAQPLGFRSVEFLSTCVFNNIYVIKEMFRLRLFAVAAVLWEWAAFSAPSTVSLHACIEIKRKL